MYGKGISREGSLIDMAVDLGIVKKSGAWFTYEGEQLGQGRENAKAFLTENPEIMVEISDKVLTQAGLRPDPNAANGDDAIGAFTPDDDAPIELNCSGGHGDSGARELGHARRRRRRAGRHLLRGARWSSSASVEGEVAFIATPGAVISLYGLANLARDAGLAAERSGFSGITLAINLESQADVDQAYDEWLAAGGTSQRAGRRRVGRVHRLRRGSGRPCLGAGVQPVLADRRRRRRAGLPA